MYDSAKVRVLGFLLLVGAGSALPTAEAAKPGGGGEDPCKAADLDFPAFVYRNASGKTHTLYVADALGKCRRAITTSTIGFLSPRFSYPVDGTSNKGRVVFFQGYHSIHVVEFTVGTGNTVDSTAKRLLLNTSGCCTLDLSRDGQTLYFSDSDASLARVQVAAPSNPETIHALPAEDSAWFFQMGSVNGDETQVFATKTGFGVNADASQLVRIDLASGAEVLLREWLPQAGYGANPFWPAADKRSERVAFNEYNQNTNNCTPLTVTDYDGNQLFPSSFATERFGRDPTWVGDVVVMQRRSPMSGSGQCSSTTSLSSIDLDANLETMLLTGLNPDGR